MKGVPVLLLAVFLAQAAFAEELIQAPAAIQITSQVSDGKYTIGQIVDTAKKNNFKVIIVTDRDVMRWQYGMFPLRNIIKKTVEQRSVFKYGIQRWLDDIKQIQAANPDIVLIPGVETAPFYYWSGNIFNQSLRLNNWHKHLLVIGLKNKADYERLPVIGNIAGLRRSASSRGEGIAFLSVLAALSGAWLLLRRRYSVKFRISGVVLLITGVLFFCNAYPFRENLFDQYHGDRGIIPYQNLIDYADLRGGLSFWAHPEAAYTDVVDNIRIETPDYAADLEYGSAGQAGTEFVIYGISANTINEYSRVFNNPRVITFLNGLFLRSDIGSYTVWTRRQ